MSRFSFSFRRQTGGGTIPPVTPDQPETPSLSDLVELGILTKPIAEFSNSDIGTTVLIPYNDPTGKILLNNGNIEFEVVGVNHHTSDAHPQTITLMTKNVIRNVAFDAKEPNNQDIDRKNLGNNRWGVSNIRQWLNSSGAAGSWWTAQHEYDAPPTSDNVSSADGAYADAPGFLAGFSADVLQHFTDITNITALCTADGGGSETTVDKVFLPSRTEMGYGKINEIAEGTHLSVRYPDNASKIKNYKSYWMRGPFYVSNTAFLLYVDNNGSSYYDGAYNSCGIAPIIVIH